MDLALQIRKCGLGEELWWLAFPPFILELHIVVISRVCCPRPTLHFLTYAVDYFNKSIAFYGSKAGETKDSDH